MWDEGSSVHIHPLSCSCWKVSVKKPWAERLSILILFVVFSIVFCYQLTLCPHTLSTAHTCIYSKADIIPPHSPWYSCSPRITESLDIGIMKLQTCQPLEVMP